MDGNNCRRRKGPPVSVQLEQEKTRGNGKPKKATKCESSEDDSDDEKDGEKWKEEARGNFIAAAAAAAREAVLRKRVTSLKQELVMEKVNSASSLSSGSNVSKCAVALKLTDTHKSQMKSFRDTHGWSRIKSYLMQTSMCTIQLHSQRCTSVF